MADFAKSIISLRKRARYARKRAFVIGVVIFSLVFYAFTFIAYSYIQKANSPFKNWPKSNITISEKAPTQKSSWRVSSDYSPKNVFDNRIEQVLAESLGRKANNLDTWLFTSEGDDNSAITSKYDPKVLESNLAPLLSGLERYSMAIKDQNKNQVLDNKYDYVSIISAFFLSIGAVAFTFLLIQTAFTFIRYFVRLAELYDAQADALEASDGDPKVAYAFIEKFSPLGVEFGKLPVNVYEKSFNAVLEIAKNKSS